MSNDKKYNGYANYSTWNCQLWLDNDESSYNYWQEAAREAFEEAEGDRAYDSQTQLERAACILADRLKEEHEESLPELSGFAADLLNSAFSEIDFYEIAENILATAVEEFEETAVEKGR